MNKGFTCTCGRYNEFDTWHEEVLFTCPECGKEYIILEGEEIEND